MDSREYADFANSLGVYQIDTAGSIQDVSILLNDIRAKSERDVMTGVKANHTLGFFIIANGKSLADTITNSDTLTFLNAKDTRGNANGSEPLFLTVNGARQTVPIYHSHAAALNPDGVQHVISGLSADGRKMMFGFEDIYGGGDQDYQDVLFSAEAILPS